MSHEYLKLPEEDKKTLWRIVFALVLSWVIVALSPFLIIKCSLFATNNAETLEDFQSVLSQLGSYGEMFGGLSVLISSFAFIAVVYTIIL